MEKHPRRTRTIGMAALAALVALVAAVSSSSAESPSSTTAPAAVTQSVENTPVQATTPQDPPAGSERDGRDCPKEDGDAVAPDASSAAPTPSPTTTAPAL